MYSSPAVAGGSAVGQTVGKPSALVHAGSATQLGHWASREEGPPTRHTARARASIAWKRDEQLLFLADKWFFEFIDFHQIPGRNAVEFGHGLQGFSWAYPVNNVLHVRRNEPNF